MAVTRSSGEPPPDPTYAAVLDSAAVSGSEGESEPTITAVLEDGPLAGRRVDVDVVEGRPPKTIDVPGDDGSTCRYCLANWVQTGPTALYTFLYTV
jgi:hypothetical protein